MCIMGRNYKTSNSSNSKHTVEQWEVRDYFKPGDIGSITSLQGTTYAKEYGYDTTFETYVAKGLAQFVQSFNPKKEKLWIVEKNNRIIGFIAVVSHSKKEAQLRWFFVHPDYRSQSIGKHLLTEAIEFCKQQSYETVFLWTTSELTTAHHLYSSAGFKKTEDNTHEIWGKTVTEERYDIQL